MIDGEGWEDRCHADLHDWEHAEQVDAIHEGIKEWQQVRHTAYDALQY